MSTGCACRRGSRVDEKGGEHKVRLVVCALGFTSNKGLFPKNRGGGRAPGAPPPPDLRLACVLVNVGGGGGGGGGCLAIFRGLMTSRRQGPRRVCACESLHPPSSVSAPGYDFLSVFNSNCKCLLSMFADISIYMDMQTDRGKYIIGIRPHPLPGWG